MDQIDKESTVSKSKIRYIEQHFINGRKRKDSLGEWDENGDL